MADGYLPVAGLGVLLPAARTGGDLADRVAAGRPLAGTVRRFTADHTDLPPVEAPAAICGDATPARRVRLSGLRRESRLALGAAADAVPEDLGGGRVGVVWVSSTAGLAEYGQTCVDAATLDPRQASPLVAAESAFNGPAAAVSIRLGLTGPHLTLTGGREAGASAVVEAHRMLAERRCRHVLVGGSASVSRWRLAGAAGHPVPGAAVPAEGAACVLLGGSAPAAGDSGVGVRPLRRARLRGPAGPAIAGFARGCLAALPAPPDAVATSAATPWWRDSSGWGGDGIPCWWVDPAGGELGAAGGLQAVVAAVAACGTGAGRVLVIAVGEAGGGADVVAVEVVSRDLASRGKEQPE